MNKEIYIPQTAYLKNVIRSIWQIEGITLFQNETIIPKGVVEIIFDFSESAAIQVELHNKFIHLPKCFINGFNTCPIQLQLPKRQIFFSVQFHPIAIKSLFDVPACEFANLTIDLTLINSSFNSLWHQLAEQKSFNQRVAVICKWIEKTFIQVHPQEQLLSSFLENNNQPALSVTELSKIIGYSPRHLSRKLYELTAMNTENVLLYKKYLHAVHLIHHTKLTLTEIAYQSNFADQSHFTKSFKSFAQINPNEYRQRKSFVQGHIFENVR
ncbi:MAG: AraC family transcriptional regulator [Bacteroidota bacterium]